MIIFTYLVQLAFPLYWQHFAKAGVYATEFNIICIDASGVDGFVMTAVGEEEGLVDVAAVAVAVSCPTNFSPKLALPS